jgi:hypothetical protein
VRCVNELGGLIQAWDAVTHTTGYQRAGLLYGRYEPDPNYRRGVKAVIEAIYEPPQSCNSAGIVSLGPDPQQAHANAIAEVFGLQLIGWAFTRKPSATAAAASAGAASSAAPTPLASSPLLPHELFAMAAMQVRGRRYEMIRVRAAATGRACSTLLLLFLCALVQLKYGASTGAAPPATPPPLPASRFVSLVISRDA